MDVGHDDSDDATALLSAVASGDRQAADQLLPLVYAQLRGLARQRMAGERKAHTLQATALVHEAYARLVKHGDPGWEGRRHFYAAAAEAMRRILVEHARARARVKRGGDGDRKRAALSIVDLAREENPQEILILDDAVRRLEGEAPEMAEVVRLRFFAGLSIDETAEALGISDSTVKRRWSWSRAWLHREISGGGRQP